MGNFNKVEIDELLDKLKVINKMYQQVRFVDPIKKKVLSIDVLNPIETEGYCFDIWKKNKICDNCISARAYNENKTFVKIEYNTQNICMVTAVPVELNHKRVIIEFMKDAANAFLLTDSADKIDTNVYSLIDRLNTMAFKDDLTKIYNRRFINERLPVDIVNALMKNNDLSIIMADLDCFKNINDTYGHIAGDEVLRKFSELLMQSIRRSEDWVARFGGEEFLVCLPGASAEFAAEIAEGVRKAIEAERFGFCAGGITITSSFGVGSLKDAEKSDFEALIDCADKKLYRAKCKGRNRVEK